jgi:hypothetical protein
MNHPLFQKIKFHLIAFAIFVAVAVVYCSPALSGKIIGANDVLMGEVMSKDAKVYYEKTGEIVHWNNNVFSGMPNTYGTGLSNYFYNIPYYFGNNILHGHFSFDTLIWIMLGAYLLLLSIGIKNNWLAIFGAIAMCLSSFNIMSLEGGHILKVLAIGCLPGMLAGLIFLARKEYYKGIIISLIYMNVTLSLNHTQISYYMIMMTILFCVSMGILLLIDGETKHVLRMAVIVAVITALSGVSNYQLFNVITSAKETIRSGTSELTDGKTKPKEGVDKDYATAWSNGKLETFCAIIPNLMGGEGFPLIYKKDENGETQLNEESETLKALQAHQNESQAYQGKTTSYWGEQSFVSGGNYFGVIVVFLFVLGLIVIQNKMKYALLIIGIFFLLLSFGKNLPAFTDIAFNYFPSYNKFRVPSMCLSVVQFIVGIIAMWGVYEFIESKKEQKQKLKQVYIAGGIVIGVLAFFYLLGPSMLPFASDMELLGNKARGIDPLPKWLLEAMKADRVAMMRPDVLRGILFCAVATGVLYAFVKDMINLKVVVPILGFLMIVDLWMVDLRFLNSSSFEEKKEITMSNADNQILQDKSDFRVFNLYRDPQMGGQPNPFNDAPTSYYHQSIGGYHPAKLRRYQELIENQIGNNNVAVWQMLNTKYIIAGDEKSGPVAQPLGGECGSAWFVPEYKMVTNGFDEMHSMDTKETDSIKWSPKKTAILWDKYAQPVVKNPNIAFDSSASIKLVSKDLHQVKYEVNNVKNNQLAIFSEIYYRQQDGDGFKAYIDGKEVEMMKANYVLRALLIPAGAKLVEFKYDSTQFDTRGKIAFFLSLIPLAIICFILFIWYKDFTKNNIAVATSTNNNSNKEDKKK